MTSPGWLADILAAVVLAVAGFSAARLVAARGARRRGEADADSMHMLMGVAMAGMFVPGLATLPAAAWAPVSGAGAGVVRRARVARPGRPRPRGRALVRLPGAAPGRLPRHGLRAAGRTAMTAGVPAAGVRLPALGLALAAGTCGYVVWLLDRPPAARAVSQAAGRLAAVPDGERFPAGSPGQPVMVTSAAPALLAPRAATCCKIAMGVAMGVMLIGVL